MSQNALQSVSKEIVYQLKNEVVEVFKKKNDMQNLILSLNTLGQFHYQLRDCSAAEENWTEGLDAVFQKLSSLDCVEELFQFDQFQNQKFFVEKYDPKSLHVGCLLVFQLAKFVYFRDLEKQRRCLSIFNNIVFFLLSSSLSAPQKLE